MAHKKSRRSRSRKSIRYTLNGFQVAFGLLFLIMGIAGITGENSFLGELGRSVSEVFGSDLAVIEILFSILELFCGIVLIATIFAKVHKRLVHGVIMAAIMFWIVVIILHDIVLPDFHSGRFDWFFWGQTLVLHIVALIALVLTWLER